MSKRECFFSLQGIAKKAIKIYGSVNGVAKEMTRAYRESGGLAELIYAAVPPIRYLFNSGSVDAIVGGWSQIMLYPSGFRQYAYTSIGNTINATIEEYSLSSLQRDGASLVISSNQAIDLTDYDTIVLEGSQTAAYGNVVFGSSERAGMCILGVSSLPCNYHLSQADYESCFDRCISIARTQKGSINLTLDVSDMTGTYYVAVGFATYCYDDNSWAIVRITMKTK